MFNKKRKTKYSDLMFDKIIELQEIGETKNIKEFISDNASLSMMAWIDYAIFVEKKDYKFAIDVLKDALHKYFKARSFSFEERELAREFTSNVLNRIHEFSMKIDIKELSDIGRIQAIVVIDAMGLEHSIELETILISLFSGVLSELEKLD